MYVSDWPVVLDLWFFLKPGLKQNVGAWIEHGRCDQRLVTTRGLSVEKIDELRKNTGRPIFAVSTFAHLK